MTSRTLASRSSTRGCAMVRAFAVGSAVDDPPVLAHAVRQAALEEGRQRGAQSGLIPALVGIRTVAVELKLILQQHAQGLMARAPAVEPRGDERVVPRPGRIDSIWIAAAIATLRGARRHDC